MLCLLPPLTNELLHKHADEWANMLHGVVPEDRLTECFELAYRDHTGVFPMGCSAMLNTWAKLQALAPPPFMSTNTCVLCEAHNNDLSVPPCSYHQKGQG